MACLDTRIRNWNSSPTASLFVKVQLQSIRIVDASAVIDPRLEGADKRFIKMHQGSNELRLSGSPILLLAPSHVRICRSPSRFTITDNTFT
jgi:hypothetical protein